MEKAKLLLMVLVLTVLGAAGYMQLEKSLPREIFIHVEHSTALRASAQEDIVKTGPPKVTTLSAIVEKHELPPIIKAAELVTINHNPAGRIQPLRAEGCAGTKYVVQSGDIISRRFGSEWTRLIGVNPGLANRVYVTPENTFVWLYPKRNDTLCVPQGMYILGDPNVFFAQLDRCIADLKAGKKMRDECGSFTDWVKPELTDARLAGVTNKRIKTRFDQIFSLAKKGKFFSSYLAEVNERGPGSLEKYFDDLKKEFK